jgi:nucleotide-binding universal stress UspA family protein
MGIEQGREIPIEEAITHWYDTVYLPVARVIQDRGLLLEFPRRTEADLYLWAMDHLSHLQEAVGWDLDPTEAADRLAPLFSQRPERIVTRIRERLLDAVTPDNLEGGPPPGYWRREWLEPGGYEALFRHILVPVSGEESGWAALDQAIEVARREGGSLRGLHVTAASDQETSARAKAIQDRFAERCREGGIPGKLVLETGQIARTICDRSRWAGLVVVHLAHPPGDTPLARLGSGMRTLLLRCARPVLVVPRVRPLDSALLAYDGSRKAGEALFVAAHLADRWQIPLSVLTVDEGNQADDRQAGARAYIESRGVEASFLRDSVRPARAILTAAEEQGCNLLIMGGYGHTPLLETLLGSTVDQVLRAGDRPVLICR